MAYTLTNPPSEKCDLTPKNRVWGFFENSNRTRPANRRKPSELRRKNRLTPTKTASGIPYWPSRDPIEEWGGVNLYGFVKNEPTFWYDYLGLSTLTVTVDRYARTKEVIYSITTMTTDDPEVNKCCCLPINFMSMEKGKVALVKGAMMRPHQGDLNLLNPGTWNGSVFRKDTLGKNYNAGGITSIEGRVRRPEGQKWPIHVPEKPDYMTQSDYDKALTHEFNTGDAGINFHAGNDAVSHSSGCTIFGDCPSPSGNGQWMVPNPYQNSLENDLRFKGSLACAKRINPNIKLRTIASALPPLQEPPVILKARVYLPCNDR